MSYPLGMINKINIPHMWGIFFYPHILYPEVIGWLESNVRFQHKYGYIRDNRKVKTSCPTGKE